VPEHFAMLARYSPVHTVRPGQVYPATLLLTAERDDRVHPAHAFKFAAAMQHAQSSAAGPAGAVLLRVEPRSGHGPGKSLQADVHEKADLYTFIAEAIGMSRDGAGPPPIWSPGALACTRSSSTAP